MHPHKFFYDISYLAVASGIHKARVEFDVYELISCDPPALFRDVTDPKGSAFTEDFGKAERWLHAEVRWDGTSYWIWDDQKKDAYTSLSGLSDVHNLHALMVRVFEFAAELMPGNRKDILE